MEFGDPDAPVGRAGAGRRAGAVDAGRGLMDDVLEALTRDCQGADWCATPHDQVTWCPAWDLWLCHGCRWQRNESALRISLEARAVMAAAAAEETVTLLWPPGTRGSR